MFPQLRKMRCNAGGAGQQVIRPLGSYLTLKSPVWASAAQRGHEESTASLSRCNELHLMGGRRTLHHFTLLCAAAPAQALASHTLLCLDPVLVQDKAVTSKLTAIMSLLHKNAPCHCPDCISSNLNRKSGSITWKAKILKLCEHKLAFNLLPSCRACSLVYFPKKWCYSIGFHCRVGRTLSPENCHLLL